jgi:hypothetical protein
LSNFDLVTESLTRSREQAAGSPDAFCKDDARQVVSSKPAPVLHDHASGHGSRADFEKQIFDDLLSLFADLLLPNRRLLRARNFVNKK